MAEAALPTIRDVEHRDAVIHELAHVSSLAAVGVPAEWRSEPSIYPAVVGSGCVVREFTRVHAGCRRKTVLGRNVLLMSGSHVGHDAQIGSGCELAPNAVIGGHVTLGANVRVGMNASILPGVTVGDNARIGAGAVVTKDVPAGETWTGVPARRQGPTWPGAAT